MKRFLSLVVAAMLCITTLSGCGSSTKTSDEKSTATEAPKATEAADNSGSEVENPLEKTIKIEIDMEDGGVIKADLYPDLAPKTVANFVKLCNEHFYDGLIFHRVIKNFMIQGGGFDTSYAQKEADTIEGEFKSNGFTQNKLKHTRGVLSMARTDDPNSASSQFFIMHAAAEHLDGEYAAFGIVTSGMEEVDKIAETPTGNATSADGNPMQDVPTEQQVIKTIKVVD